MHQGDIYNTHLNVARLRSLAVSYFNRHREAMRNRQDHKAVTYQQLSHFYATMTMMEMMWQERQRNERS